MLTRLKVSGFKNLVDVDVRFGPFTCIAGANGVGKSNLFDAIRFLSALAEQTLMEAAKSVRGGRTADVRGLFHRVGNRYADRMCFEAEMIVPKQGVDDLGQETEASTTFLHYSLELALRSDKSRSSLGELEIRKEELRHITQGNAYKHLSFPLTLEWRRSVVQGRQTTPFISTGQDGSGRTIIQLHQNQSGGSKGGSGKPAPRLAETLPRTVLSVTNAAEQRTAVLARREMQSWRLLQLEPSAMREPDEFAAPPQLGVDGSHLAATLYRLARAGETLGNGEPDEQRVYAVIANRLAELIDDVRELEVDQDEKRGLLTLLVKGRDGTAHPARALSDGTLRFLALAAIDLDPAAQGLLCLEEPENGIHPARIPAMLRLLQDIATDTDQPAGLDNPLRQVIVNTHSPAVVSQVPDASLVVAELKEGVVGEQYFRHVSFGCLPDTWRATRIEDGGAANIVSKGKLLAYLNPLSSRPAEPETNGHKKTKTRRVMDRPDLQMLLFSPDGAAL